MVLSGGTDIMGAVAELVRVAKAAAFRIERNRAVAAGTVDAFDAARAATVCPHFLAGSDLPNQLTGDIVPPIWHAIQAAVFLTLVLSNLCVAVLLVPADPCGPGQDLMKKTSKLFICIGSGVGTWAEGALQMLSTSVWL